jgi:hypothetical protein
VGGTHDLREEVRNLHISVGASEENGQLARYRCRWEDNIKTDFKETGRKGVDRIQLPEDSFQ